MIEDIVVVVICGSTTLWFLASVLNFADLLTTLNIEVVCVLVTRVLHVQHLTICGEVSSLV